MVCPSEVESGQECIIRLFNRPRKKIKGDIKFVSPLTGRVCEGVKATLLYSLTCPDGKSVDKVQEHWKGRFLLDSPLLMRDGENEISIVDRYMGDFMPI